MGFFLFKFIKLESYTLGRFFSQCRGDVSKFEPKKLLKFKYFDKSIYTKIKDYVWCLICPLHERLPIL